MAGHRTRRPVILSFTPLIDVVFILLVFFMLASQMSDWRHVTMLPQASAGQAAADSEAVAAIFGADGRVRIDGHEALDIAEAASLAATRSRAAGPGGQRSVVIRPHDTTPVQHVVDLLSGLADHGAGRVHIEDRPETAQ